MISIFLITQFCYIHRYNQHTYDSNPLIFANNFDLIVFHRTNLHSKGLKHWYEWIESFGKYFKSSTITLLHFDTHAHDDVISEEIYECSPGQFFQYDQMVIEILESTQDLIDNFIDLDNTENITNEMMNIGYFSTVVWVYPDHWINFSTVITYDVHYKLYRQYAHHQTYYITPLSGLKHKYSMLKSSKDPTDKHKFWSNILFKNSIEIVNHEMNSSESLQIDIMAIPLSALLSDPHLIHKQHHIVLDIDLDLFCCQNIAENIMERFEWSNDVIHKLNTILNHHQYLPNHIPNNLYQEALITLMYIFTKNENIPTEHQDNQQISVPIIADIIELVSKNTSDLNIFDLHDILHFLFRFQLELGEQFMEPLQLFLSTHKYLDTLFDATEHGTDRWQFMPYNHSKHRKQWHWNLAKTLDMEEKLSKIDETFTISSTLSLDGSVINQTNNDYFETKVLPLLKSVEKQFSVSAKTKRNSNDTQMEHINDISSTKDETKPGLYSADDVLQIGIMLQHALQFTEHQHKISATLIQTYFNQTKQHLFNLDMQNITRFISNQDTKIWNPDHGWFHENMNAKKKQILSDIKPDSLNGLSYPQMLQMFGIDPSYRYSMKLNESQPINNETAKPIPFNKAKLSLTTHNIDDVINWTKLDKIQKHFLQNGDHRAMRRFINDLNEKQKVFLKWLLFCFYHPTNCEDGHNPFELMKNDQISNVIFGERFPWNELIRIPGFVPSLKPENRGLLQLEFVSLGATQKWLPTKINEENHIPTKHEIKQTLNVMTKYLSLKENNVVAGGIELSRGYVPIKYQIWIECLLMKTLNQALQYNNSNLRTSFLRYQHFLSDDSIAISSKIPNCLKHITSPYI